MHSNAPTTWLRVNRHSRCPCCGSDSWCGVSNDGLACVCMRLESPKRTRNGGYLHKLDQPIDRSKLVKFDAPKLAPAIDCDKLMGLSKKNICAEDIDMLAADLGVSEQSLVRLGIGYSITLGAYTFPMRDPSGRIIGFRTRNHNGKWAVPGSKAGLFIPDGLGNDGLLVICEGPTDAAAAMTLGYEAIGRPSCRGQEAMVLAVVRRRSKPVAWIVADADGPGRDGASALADMLTEVAPTKLFNPPRHKDLRAWAKDGATYESVQAIAWHRSYWQVKGTNIPKQGTAGKRFPAGAPVVCSQKAHRYAAIDPAAKIQA